VALVLTIIFAGIMPTEKSQAQDVMDKSTMTFTSISIVNASGESAILRSAGSISGIGSNRAIINEGTVDLIYDGKTVGTLKMPKLELKADPTNFDMDAKLTVTNMDYFNEFNRAVVFHKTVTWTLKGSVKVAPKIGSSKLFPVDVDFDKTITVNGCNGLANNDRFVYDESIYTYANGDVNCCRIGESFEFFY